jgi:hypothetical protein
MTDSQETAEQEAEAERPRLGAIDRCRSCRGRIVWCRTENNRSMPVDPEPNSDGNLTVTDRDYYGTAIVTVQTQASLQLIRENRTPDLYMPHFKSCPNYPKRQR